VIIILVSFAWVFGNTLNAQQAESRDVVHADVCVYGGTPGGITAAISAAREGASVVLLEQTKHVGGLSTSGLNRD
jgi:NADPH-dependent 2,4-dienoyl-CoA reductase/sulfur reductase-like enzyme